MLRINLGSALGLVSIVVVFLALVTQPLREIFLQKFADFVLLTSTSQQSLCVVYDTARDITYHGTSSQGVEHFREIFYAQDTSGTNRFAPPVKYDPPRGSVVDATKPDAWCPQGVGEVLPFTSVITNISENCLSLRISRATGAKAGEKMPVLVWLHGGGHALGSGSEILYEPDGLVKQSVLDDQPVLWVAVNYRLGFFGFATSKAMVSHKYSNVGLRDQRAALEWVRDHIEAFGGDPNRVTAIGQSVGASDISLHLISFGGKGKVPFQKAIMMSGGPGLNFNTKSDLVANNTWAVAQSVGCSDHGDGQSEATLECLQMAPFEELTNVSVSAMRAARPPFGEGFFYPTYDNDFLTDRPSVLMRQGKFIKDIPSLASWVANEGAWYALPTTATDSDVLASFSLWLFGLSELTKERLLELYPLSDFEHMVRREYDGPISAQYYRAAQINKDFWFTCPVLDFSWQYVKMGGIEPEQMRIYEHNATRYTPSFEMMSVPMWRVAHLSDIPYVLNNQHLGGGADNSLAQLKLAKTMSRSILEFVTDSKPAGSVGGVTDWPGAFEGISKKKIKQSSSPSRISLQLFGGPYGTQPVTVEKEAKSKLSDAEQAVASEKLFERCEFINSDVVREEAGV